jgi:hypothetical protein
VLKYSGTEINFGGSQLACIEDRRLSCSATELEGGRPLCRLAAYQLILDSGNQLREDEAKHGRVELRDYTNVVELVAQLPVA